MKYFLVVVFLISILGFGSSITPSLLTGLKLPWTTQKWMKTAGGSHDNMINKRQSEGEDDFPDECEDAQFRLLCETNIFEQAIRLYLNCGRNDDAVEIATSCDRNAAGEVCGIYEASDAQLSAAVEECLPRSPSADTCPSAACTTLLEAVRSSPPGCCVDALYNRSNFEVDEAILDYTLWSQCGVETLDQCEETFSTTPVPNPTPCTDREITRQLLMLQCSGQFNTILNQVEDMEGCSGIRTGLSSLCQVNSQGENCQLLVNQTQINTAQNECTFDQTTCSDSCREALEKIQREQECCFNFFFNNTELNFVLSDEQQFITRNTLWSQCGVETPPLTCRNLLSKAHGKDLAIFTLIAALLVAMWN